MNNEIIGTVNGGSLVIGTVSNASPLLIGTISNTSHEAMPIQVTSLQGVNSGNSVTGTVSNGDNPLVTGIISNTSHEAMLIQIALLQEQMQNYVSVDSLDLSIYALKTELPDMSKITYVHEQMISSNVWKITHNLGRYPNITVIDSGGTVVAGEIVYVTQDNLILTFSAEFSGKALLS